MNDNVDLFVLTAFNLDFDSLDFDIFDLLLAEDSSLVAAVETTIFDDFALKMIRSLRSAGFVLYSEMQDNEMTNSKFIGLSLGQIKVSKHCNSFNHNNSAIYTYFEQYFVKCHVALNARA